MSGDQAVPLFPRLRVKQTEGDAVGSQEMLQFRGNKAVLISWLVAPYLCWKAAALPDSDFCYPYNLENAVSQRWSVLPSSSYGIVRAGR